MTSITHLLYLHGFRSSPQSTKARMTHAWIDEHLPEVEWRCPQLPPSPRAAMALAMAQIEGWEPATMGVIGSSLGGFYATIVAERTGCRAILLNPAIHPARDLAQHIGETKAWHSDERFYFRGDYVEELRELTPSSVTHPDRYFAVIAKGDEVLDWHEMRARYAGCRIKLLEGSDHALSDYRAHLPDVVRFLGLSVPVH